MRFLMAIVLLAASLPLAGAPDGKQQCGVRCSQDYQTCLKRARTKAARKSCTVSRKTCKRGCSVR